MVFSGTATCHTDKEMDTLLSTLDEMGIDPDIYGRRVLVDCVLADGKEGKAKLDKLIKAFEAVRIHGTLVTRRR